MVTEGPDQKRWDEIKALWSEWKSLYTALGFILGLLAFPVLQLIITDLSSLLSNLVPEAIGIIFTVFLIDRFYALRDEERSIRELKKRLIREAKGKSNEVAKSAIDWMREEKWLTVSDRVHLLEGCDLSYSELEGANLRFANLKGSHFVNANLHFAYLQGADLRATDMTKIYMVNAWITTANLEKSNLKSARLMDSKMAAVNLLYADLTHADLRGTVLSEAYLLNAKIADCIFDDRTVLPDAVPSQDQVGNDMYDKFWTPGTDMTRYTDPAHPDFWEPQYLRPDWDRKSFTPYEIPDWVKNIRRERFGEQ